MSIIDLIFRKSSNLMEFKNRAQKLRQSEKEVKKEDVVTNA
ncbi:hypothetical protein Desgi_2925 [Desulfoscipio gibsoniae DSM 7213]|uniref:Uncharacterized protein n=1 Tax=Desulfoscipio gibsoniae DSM 7213 TaxID=767817 RepID=R4KI76_9FIRM|nr:hypothetical protein Desgi_2925 [Desulfoscipio gibsoniae DSM 7213]